LLLEPSVGRALVDGQGDVAHLAQAVGHQRDAVRLELALEDLAALVLDLVCVGVSHLSVPLVSSSLIRSRRGAAGLPGWRNAPAPAPTTHARPSRARRGTCPSSACRSGHRPAWPDRKSVV